ncbi:citryl-CoA lyase [Methylocella sp. CPCC 101449]|uniref:citryl-CoA lyase n=1 Tax=Methylocella sp. CPCC 101449 TaxID=2987531 RepID=UPI0028928937|nr:citryl-CoA lyase [Methylocella sp. CPCC 101449]MDT2021857.1 citryl-CoA lyase [Methylocella sp. CPCC 101449]
MSERAHTTRTGTSTTNGVRVRGHDMINDLVGRYSYTEMLYFLTCGSFPTPPQVRVLDACLVTLMEHGLTPSAVISRLMADSVPEEPQVAIAAGLLAIGSVYAGTTESCAVLLEEIAEREAKGERDVRRTIARAYAAQRRPVPGFGHGTHKPDDPRTPRLFEIARDNGCHGAFVASLLALQAEVDQALGRHLTINATGAIGALLLEIKVPVAAMRAFSVVSRAGGLVGHLLEERSHHSARAIWAAAKRDIRYTEEP